MARTRKKHNTRNFVILIAIVLIIGVILWMQGDLINPVQNTASLMNTSPEDGGFAMVGDQQTSPEHSESASVTDNGNEASTGTGNTVVVTNTAGQMSKETLIAELTAAGVDVNSVTANLNAQGKSLDNLLVVVNSGRVTVDELAMRLNGETPNDTQSPSREGRNPLLDLHWEEFGGVVFDLWFILVVTILVIILARPVGWLVKQIKQIPRTAS